ncbi:MAG: MBL fold metallo-hydrolase [Sulfurimonadaceae bacterium]|jgi:flavorubredoxin|nr:MBL fold metallo-hydrolase [Sulfurimonadaceae bacterium]
MDREHILYDDGIHKCVMFSFDDEAHEDSFLSVNQFLIVQNESAILIDPGSETIFEDLSEAIERHVKIENIKFIFLSHQDPDVAGSITQWSVSTSAKFIISSLWVRFMSHYGFLDMGRIIALPDHGAKLHFGEEYIKFVPAHFLHSPGNFSLYDSASKILFSGDIGAAIINAIENKKYVENFSEHIKHLEGFHKRYMGSNKLLRAWVAKVQELDVEMIAPQHGFVFRKKEVQEFLAWLKELQAGSDYSEELYGV